MTDLLVGALIGLSWSVTFAAGAWWASRQYREPAGIGGDVSVTPRSPSPPYSGTPDGVAGTPGAFSRDPIFLIVPPGAGSLN